VGGRARKVTGGVAAITRVNFIKIKHMHGQKQRAGSLWLG